MVTYPSGCDVLKLTMNGDLEYHIYPCEVDLAQEKPSFSISPPNTGPRENIKMAMEGMTLTIDVTFTIWDDGQDRANSANTSYGSTVKTVGEQIDYLYEEMHDPSLTASWTLEQVQNYYKSNRLPLNSSGNPKYEGIVANLNCGTVKKEEIKWLTGNRLTFEVGGTV